MQPIEPLFQIMAQAIRDRAQAQGKRVEVSLDGVQVELDGSVLEKIHEPMLQIIQHIVTHEIGKDSEHQSETTLIRLGASPDIDGVSIRISYDEAKAAASDLAAFETLSHGDELLRTVLPMLQSLRAHIDFERLEQITSINVSLPVSINTVEALVVKCQSLAYAIPLHDVSEIIDIGLDHAERSAGKDRMVWLRGEVVPAQSLAHYLGPLNASARRSAHVQEPVTNQHRPLLIAKGGAGPVAFEVDEIVNQQPIVIRELEGKLRNIHGFSGTTILGDGQPGFILSLPAFASRYFKANERGETRHDPSRPESF
jgi:two-component system chemotaxis sensor kinase CheA